MTEHSGLLQQQKNPMGGLKNYETMFGRKMEKPNEWFARHERLFLGELRSRVPREPLFRHLVAIVHDHTSGNYYYARQPATPIPHIVPGANDAEPTVIDFLNLSVALQSHPHVVNFIGKIIRLLRDQQRVFSISRISHEYEIPDSLAEGALETISTKLGPALRGTATCYTVLLNDHETAMRNPRWKQAILRCRDPVASRRYLAQSESTMTTTEEDAEEEEEDDDDDDEAEGRNVPRIKVIYTINTESAVPTTSRSDTPDDTIIMS